MKVTYPRCCGLDVHKKTVVACAMTPRRREVRTFTTMTGDLLALKEWLLGLGITHVAMESTGVYWKPIYNLLEHTFTLLVVNAQHIKAVPGRKTDVKDAEWIADLLRHGLLRGSFIPDRSVRELRELVRYRRTLIHDRSRIINRIQKTLEGANIKLASVATDVVGVSGRIILEAMIDGVEDPKALAALPKASCSRRRMTSNKRSWDSWALISAGCLRANSATLITWTEKSPLLMMISRAQWDLTSTLLTNSIRCMELASVALRRYLSK